MVCVPASNTYVHDDKVHMDQAGQHLVANLKPALHCCEVVIRARFQKWLALWRRFKRRHFNGGVTVGGRNVDVGYIVVSATVRTDAAAQALLYKHLQATRGSTKGRFYRKSMS